MINCYYLCGFQGSILSYRVDRCCHPPLIKPCVQFSLTRLSDILHRQHASRSKHSKFTDLQNLRHSLHLGVVSRSLLLLVVPNGEPHQDIAIETV